MIRWRNKGRGAGSNSLRNILMGCFPQKNLTRLVSLWKKV